MESNEGLDDKEHLQQELANNQSDTEVPLCSEGQLSREVGVEDFLFDNFIKSGEFYFPKDPSQNKYRHFGRKTKEGLCLRYEEVLFIYSSECPHNAELKTRAYFDLKNCGFNVLFNHGMELYEKTKHFNRQRDKPLRKLEYVHMDQDIFGLCAESIIAAVLGCDEYSFLSIKPVDELSHETPENLRKR